jgi:hypothetical protein
VTNYDSREWELGIPIYSRFGVEIQLQRRQKFTKIMKPSPKLIKNFGELNEIKM